MRSEDGVGATEQATQTPEAAPQVAPVVRPTDAVRSLLAPYAHIARCPGCISFALSYWPVEPDHRIQAATLTYHDSGHRFDPWENGFCGF